MLAVLPGFLQEVEERRRSTVSWWNPATGHVQPPELRRVAEVVFAPGVGDRHVQQVLDGCPIERCS